MKSGQMARCMWKAADKDPNRVYGAAFVQGRYKVGHHYCESIRRKTVARVWKMKSRQMAMCMWRQAVRRNPVLLIPVFGTAEYLHSCVRMCFYAERQLRRCAK